MLTGGDGIAEPRRDPHRMNRDLSVPLSSLASSADVVEARDILDIHADRPVVRRVCIDCGSEWPCPDALYAMLITGASPEPSR